MSYTTYKVSKELAAAGYKRPRNPTGHTWYATTAAAYYAPTIEELLVDLSDKSKSVFVSFEKGVYRVEVKQTRYHLYDVHEDPNSLADALAKAWIAIKIKP